MASTLTFTCRRFSFTHMVLSHGWVHLAPFTWNDEQGELGRTLRVGSSRLFQIVIGDRNRRADTVVVAHVSPAPEPIERKQLRQQVRRMLRLDEDFSDFHVMCRHDNDLRFVAEQRCGGMLRGPTTFEDLIKTICTINCDWRNTKNMCQRLCAGGAQARQPMAPSPARAGVTRITRESWVHCGFAAPVPPSIASRAVCRVTVAAVGTQHPLRRAHPTWEGHSAPPPCRDLAEQQPRRCRQAVPDGTEDTRDHRPPTQLASEEPDCG